MSPPRFDNFLTSCLSSPLNKAPLRLIDEQLAAAGWLVQDYKSLNLGPATGIAVREVPLAAGRCDYQMQAVSGEDAHTKDHFVLVDAVGVCDSDKPSRVRWSVCRPPAWKRCSSRWRSGTGVTIP